MIKLGLMVLNKQRRVKMTKIIKSLKAELELREVQLEQVIQAECSRWAKQLGGNINCGGMNKDHLKGQIYALKTALQKCD